MGMPAVRTDACPVFGADYFNRRFDLAEIDCAPHAVERKIRETLISQSGLNISSLVVHRMRDGVCLTGIVESMPGGTDVCGLVRETVGVNEVLNRLIVRSAN